MFVEKKNMCNFILFIENRYKRTFFRHAIPIRNLNIKK